MRDIYSKKLICSPSKFEPIKFDTSSLHARLRDGASVVTFDGKSIIKMDRGRKFLSEEYACPFSYVRIKKNADIVRAEWAGDRSGEISCKNLEYGPESN
ncbi:hypothetical protein EVAR_7666_1 [Eumeta japonica]|uniref:Uncharacterized protein n=1 Tax=Eumeta variegata TaxID=151549 RepID=A0A4C1TIB2_EUMVA|nr:hypothetical protein EVAR_7666_1 [Eumeta japonica]